MLFIFLQRIHLDIQVGEHANDYQQIAAKDKLTELQLRVRQLLDQVEQITKEQNYQRVCTRHCILSTIAKIKSNVYSQHIQETKYIIVCIIFYMVYVARCKLTINGRLPMCVNYQLVYITCRYSGRCLFCNTWDESAPLFEWWSLFVIDFVKIHYSIPLMKARLIFA